MGGRPTPEERQLSACLEKAIRTPHEAQADLPEIISLLGSQDSATRVNAAWAIGLVIRSHPETIPEILPRLIPYLRHPVRERDAARVLAYIADHFRNWTRMSIENNYSTEKRDEIQPLLSQLDDPNADIGPDDVFVLELLSNRSVSNHRERTRQKNQKQENRRPNQQKDSTDADTRTAATTVDKRDSNLIRKIERRSSNLDTFENETKSTTTPEMSIYKVMASVEGTTRGVVLKVLNHSTPDRALVAEWERSLNYWKLIDDHSRSATLFDAGQYPRPWIAVECIEKGSLLQRSAIPIRKRMEEAQTLVDTLVYAHRHGVVHGRLQPTNVLYTQPLEARSQIAKITDWCVSRTVATHTDTTHPPLVPYAAPEQLHDESDSEVDQYTDIYQLGACLYRLFTDQAPFDSSSRGIRRAVAERLPPSPSNVNPQLPTHLDEVLLKAMAKHKKNRYESVERLQTALGDVCS